jgi:tol-pal system protein YbgF
MVQAPVMRPSSAWRPSALVLAAAMALLPMGSAHALFSDDEARKAILELRARLNAQEEAQKAREAELKAAQARVEGQLKQQDEQLQALRRSILELNSQLEALRTELARMRGADEQLAKEVAEVQRRQRDITAGIDDRLRRIEPIKVTVDGLEFNAEPDEKKAYEDALAIMRTGDFDKALQAFQTLLKRWPASGYLASVQFWSGNAQYGRKDFREAVAQFRAFLAGAPNHPRAPEAMLGLANSQVEMKDVRAARKTLEDLQKAFPNTEAAAAAKQRLTSLR